MMEIGAFSRCVCVCVDEFSEIERVTPSENKRKLKEWLRMNQQKGTSLPHTCT